MKFRFRTGRRRDGALCARRFGYVGIDPVGRVGFVKRGGFAAFARFDLLLEGGDFAVQKVDGFGLLPEQFGLLAHEGEQFFFLAGEQKCPCR